MPGTPAPGARCRPPAWEERSDLTVTVAPATKEAAMQWFKAAVIVVLFGFTAGSAWAAHEISPGVQKELDRHIEIVKTWAANPTVVKAVQAQNAKGPIAGMDNAKWKTVRRSDELVRSFQNNEAGQFLKKKCGESNGLYPEAFLNAEKGEKVAFFEKTTSYVHKGSAKFDVPFGSKRSWQGPAEFDESSQTHQVQVSVPVLDGGNSIGVLVVGVSLTTLEKTAKK
jgi:hypothetical protein